MPFYLTPDRSKFPSKHLLHYCIFIYRYLSSFVVTEPNDEKKDLTKSVSFSKIVTLRLNGMV